MLLIVKFQRFCPHTENAVLKRFISPNRRNLTLFCKMDCFLYLGHGFLLRITRFILLEISFWVIRYRAPQQTRSSRKEAMHLCCSMCHPILYNTYQVGVVLRLQSYDGVACLDESYNSKYPVRQHGQRGIYLLVRYRGM